MADKKILSLEEKEQLAEAVRTYPCLYDKSKKEYKSKNLCENAWGTAIKKLEFIEIGKYFRIFLSLYSSEIEWNFLYISLYKYQPFQSFIIDF